MPTSIASRRLNRDGSRNVSCAICKEHIATVPGSAGFSTAICKICQLDRAGTPLPKEVIAQMRSKSLEVTYSDQNWDPILERHVNSYEEIETVNSVSFAYRVVSRIKRVAKAVVEAVKEGDLPKPVEQSSKEIAISKRRRRIFDGPIDPA